MNFIRPEVARLLFRWRESLAGAAAAVLGIYLLVFAAGALWLVGGALAIGGILLAVAGLQRGRFRQGSDGPGVVQLTEGQLTYFGPFDGGTMAVEAVARLELGRTGGQPARWTLYSSDGTHLHIPVDATGSEDLFDVFAALPGLKTETVLSALRSPPDHQQVIWQKPTARLH